MFPIAVCVPHTYTNKCNRYNIHVLYVYTAHTFSYVHKIICRKRLQISKKIGRNLQFSRIFFYLAVYFWRSSCRKVSVFYWIFLLPFIFENIPYNCRNFFLQCKVTWFKWGSKSPARDFSEV